jgi:formylglycine-generating enzyme required for sulfatase activity
LAKYALLVGVDAYAHGSPLPLCTPVPALDALRDALRCRSVGGFKGVRLLRNPSHAQLMQSLFEWCIALGRADMLLLYVACAGRLDAAGRAHLLLPGCSGNPHAQPALALAAITNSVQVSACTRRVLLLDVGFVAPTGVWSPARNALARERMTVAGTAVLASAAGEPFAAADGEMPPRRLLGPWLTSLLTRPVPAAPRVVTVNALYQELLRSTPPGERMDVPRLWLSHVHRGALVLARNPAAPRGTVPVKPTACTQADAPAGASALEPRRRELGRGPRGWSGAPVTRGPLPVRGSRRPSRRGDRWHAARGNRRLRGALRVPARLLGLALLGPMALFLAGDEASRNFQLAAAKLLHRAAPGVFNQVFVEQTATYFSDSLRSGGRGPPMVALPGGFFMMGSRADEPERQAGEGPLRRVGVDPFALGAAEVSFAEYDHFARATGRPLPADGGWGRGSRPVINVSWGDAVAYARWLSDETGARYSLPTEAQWEYAARAGTDTPFVTGGCIHTDQANYNGAFDYASCGARTGVFRGFTLPATMLPPSRWGFYHLHGNVWEWVSDCWRPVVRRTPGNTVRAAAPTAATADDCDRRVMRGGGWRFEPGFLRSAARIWSEPTARTSDTGFRVARALSSLR